MYRHTILINCSIYCINYTNEHRALTIHSTIIHINALTQVYKSVIPDMFDLSSPKKQVMSTLLEYNSLQDPHLRSYFYHSPRRCKLKETGFITDDLDVICSLKKYNAYRQFLDGEFMKVYQHKYRESLQVNLIVKIELFGSPLMSSTCMLSVDDD